MNDVTMKIRQLSQAAISPAKFAHFVLRSGQFDKMTEWYRTVLAARIVFRDERLCFLSYDDEHHRLALIHIPGLPPRDPESAGTDHVAYSYRDLGELLATYRRLKAHGILPHWPINHGVTTSMYYRDPDNNRVELQIDNSRLRRNCRVISRAPRLPPIGSASPMTRSSWCAITRRASRSPISYASLRCPRARARGTC
jgi:catechol-2,3-dioxygenase